MENIQILAILILAIVFGVYYKGWISPILTQRWSFYPQEILWSFGYFVALICTDFFSDGISLVDVIVNFISAIIAVYLLRYFTWLEIQQSKENE